MRTAKVASSVVAALFFLSLVAFGSATFYQVSFQGFTVGKTDVQAGGSLPIRTNVANLAQGPYTDLTIVASLIRNSDRTRVMRTVVDDDMDLGPRELILLNQSLAIPPGISAGNYSLVLQAYTPVGIPMTFVSEDVQVTNEGAVRSVRFGKQGVYLVSKKVVVGDNVVTSFSLPSFGSQGENVLPGTNFSINFSLTNDGGQPLDLRSAIDIVPTYSVSGEPVKTIDEQLGTLQPGETQQYSIATQLSEPGTYEVNVAVTDAAGNSLGTNEVRLVIAGGGGSIVDVKNAQDTYTRGETVSVDTTIVGPADGSTVIRDAFLRMQVLKDGDVVTEREQTVDRLPFNPVDRTFGLSAPEELQQYTVRLVLGKGDTVYDTFTASYEPITVERKLTASGQVKQAGACFTNDVCTQAEYEAGGCYDCIGVETPPGREPGQQKKTGGIPQGVIVIAFLIGGIVAGAVIYRQVT